MDTPLTAFDIVNEAFVPVYVVAAIHWLPCTIVELGRLVVFRDLKPVGTV
jgi:hypothetical protein